jgi:hypothetical protein
MRGIDRYQLATTAPFGPTMTVSVVRRGGEAVGYRAYYARNKIENLDVAFVTKLLYFAGYRSPHRPRPLIYDSLVAAAAARFPSAPLFPLISDSVTTSSYQRYCAWAEGIAEKYQTEPAVIEWSFFTLGADIREELRKRPPPDHGCPAQLPGEHT